MAGFKIADFRGRYPGIERRYIPENAATVATDLKLGYADIRPLYGYESTGVNLVQRNGETAQPQTLYYYERSRWVHFGRDVSIVTAPVGQDKWKRMVFTFNGDSARAPLVSGVVPNTGINEVTSGNGPYPSTWYAFGVPAPVLPPTITLLEGGGDVEDQRTFYYCFVQVNDRGELSKASLPSLTSVAVDEGAPFAVEVLCQTTTDFTADTYNTQYRPVKKVYVYRLYAEDETLTWLYVGEESVGNNGVVRFIDRKKTSELDGDVLLATDWDPPPVGLSGIRSLPNGCIVGYIGNEVVLSAAGFPFAFPEQNRYVTEYDIVAIGVFSSTVVVLTTGVPYLLHGVDPSAMTLVKLDVDQSCVSNRSVVEYGDRVVWASPDGLFSVGVNGTQSLTQMLMDKRVWRSEFSPESIHAYGYEGLYVAFSNGAGFVFNPLQPEGGIVDLSTYATACFRDLETDTLYAALPNAPYSTVYKFDSDEANPFEWEWRSRVIEFPKHVSPARAQVIGTSYPFEVDTAYLSDTGELVMYDTNIPVSTRNPVTLSSGTLSTDWVVTIRGTGECEAFVLGETIRDIKEV